MKRRYKEIRVIGVENETPTAALDEQISPTRTVGYSVELQHVAELDSCMLGMGWEFVETYE